MAIHEAGEFKGNKMIVLKSSPESEYPFQFGQKKAELIVACYEAIKKFAETGVIDGATETPAPSDRKPSDADIPF